MNGFQPTTYLIQAQHYHQFLVQFNKHHQAHIVLHARHNCYAPIVCIVFKEPHRKIYGQPADVLQHESVVSRTADTAAG